MNFTENYKIDGKTFCSFFNMNNDSFKYYDRNSVGVINSFIVITILYLLKKENNLSKIESNKS